MTKPKWARRSLIGLTAIIAMLTAAFVVQPALAQSLAPQPAAHQLDNVPEPPSDVEVVAVDGERIYFLGPSGYFYFGDGYFVIAGGPIEDVCAGPPDMEFGVSTKLSDGQWQSRLPTALYRALYLYEFDGSSPDDIGPFLGSVCPAIAQGGDAPPIVAKGWARQSASITKDTPYWSLAPGPQEDGLWKNGIAGWAWDNDGTKMRVSARVEYEVIDGEFQPPITDQFSVKPVGG